MAVLAYNLATLNGIYIGVSLCALAYWVRRLVAVIGLDNHTQMR